MHPFPFAHRAVTLAALSVLALGCETASSGPAESAHGDYGTVHGALTAEQCSFFAAGDTVTICHKTSSAKKPYTVIKTNHSSCDGHSLHAGDYIGYNDPTCNGQGCFPAGAPYDGTVECCEGLAPEGGYCAVAACPASASGAPACTCDAGYDGALAWSFTSTAWTGECADSDECANGSAACAEGTTCANTPGSFTCTANAQALNELVSEYQQYEDATVEEEGEFDEEAAEEP